MRTIQCNLNAKPILSQADLLLVKELCDQGELLVCPTESSYLLGGNALDQKVSKSIYEMKERERGKPLPIIVAHRQMASNVGLMNEWADKIADCFWPGPVTIIIPARQNVPSYLIAGTGTIGLRVSAFPLLQEIFTSIDYPLVSTSANISGSAEPYNPQSFLGELSKRKNHIGCFIDGGVLPENKPSTVIDLTGEKPRLLREGTIPAQKIMATLMGE